MAGTIYYEADSHQNSTGISDISHIRRFACCSGHLSLILACAIRRKSWRKAMHATRLAHPHTHANRDKRAACTSCAIRCPRRGMCKHARSLLRNDRPASRPFSRRVRSAVLAMYVCACGSAFKQACSQTEAHKTHTKRRRKTKRTPKNWRV